MHNQDIENLLIEREGMLTREYEEALDLAGFRAQEAILDVGTGSGRMLLQLLKRGCSVVSGDINPEALTRAWERLGDLANKPIMVILDAHKIQFDDASFNAVTLVNAIHEMDDPIGALNEITRVLTPYGKILVVEFTSQGFEMMELHNKMQGQGEHPKGDMSTEQINHYLVSNFDHVETREFCITHAWVASGKKHRGNR